MKLSDLKTRVQVYLRDLRGNKFTDQILTSFLREAVDRIRSYSVFSDMPYPDDIVEVSFLPERYHYLLAVYASSRLFELDNDYYQATQRRNEFEHIFLNDLIPKIEAGEIIIKDSFGNEAINDTIAKDYVVDEYFGGIVTDEDNVI